MINAVYFSTTTGEILRTATFDDDALTADIDALAPAGCDWIDAVASLDDYIDDPGGTNTVTARPTLYDETFVTLMPDGSDSVSFSLPSGTEVLPEDGVKYTTSGSTTFTFSAPGFGEWVYHFDPPFPTLPLTLTMRAVTRQIGTKEVAAAAIEPANLNSEVVSVNNHHVAGPITLTGGARNIVAEVTLTFEPVDVALVWRRFSLFGVVGSTATLLTAVGRLCFNVDTGSGWTFPVGTYFYESNFRALQGNLTGSCHSVYDVAMSGATTEISFGLECYLASGESGELKNCNILVIHHATAEAA